MPQDQIARATTTIDAPRAAVWDALVNPDKIKQYMFGTTVQSEWKPNAPITWKGQWKGKAYEDKGKIVRIEPERTLQYTHFSPLTGEPDIPENYHTVTIELSGNGSSTNVTLTQDHNATAEAKEHSEKNWKMMLDGLKKLLES